jgi:translocation and assembly module TamB
MSEPAVPTRSKRKRRRIVQVILGLCALAVVLVLSLPLWLPWLLVPGLRMAGVEISSYERVSYSRIALHEARFANENLIFTAARIETLQPAFWAARLARGGGVDHEGQDPERRSQMPIEVDDWHLELLLAGQPRDEPSVNSTAEALDMAQTALKRVSRLRPGLDLQRGTIRHENEVLQVPRIAGGLDRIEGEFVSERLEEPLKVEVGWSTGEPTGSRFTLEAATTLYGEPLLSRTVLTQTAGETGWNLEGSGTWSGNDWRYEGVFGPRDWWPAEMDLDAAGWNVSLRPWEIPGYKALEGGVRLSWADEVLDIAMNWEALPMDDATQQTGRFEQMAVAVPPVEIAFSAQVSFTQVVVDELSVESPALRVVLGQAIEVNLATRTLAQPATLEFLVRFEELGLSEELIATVTDRFPAEADPTPLQGSLSGTLQALPNPEGWPVAILQVSSSGFGWSDWQVDALELEAELNWPEARLSGLELELRNGMTMKADGHGRIPERQLEEFRLSLALASEVVRPFLPEAVSFERIDLEFDATGQITPAMDRLLSSGQLEITDLALPSLQRLDPVQIRWAPSEVPLELDAQSEHHWQVALRADESAIDVEGAVQFALNAGWFQVPLHHFEWRPGTEEAGLPAVNLDAPVTITLREDPGTANDPEPLWTLTLPETIVRVRDVAGLDAGRPGGERTSDSPSARLSAEVTWPRRGDLALSLDQWSAQWLRDWLMLPVLDETAEALVWGAGLDRLSIIAGWDDGPLDYRIEMAAHAPHPLHLTADTAETLHVTARLLGNEAGARLDAFRVEDNDGAWLEGNGALSLVVAPADISNPVRWDPAGLLEFLGTVERREEFAVSVPNVGQVDLKGLAVQIQASGSILEPKGSIRGGFEQLILIPLVQPEEGELPVITDMEVNLGWRPDGIELESLALTVAGQPVQMAAALPLEEGFWAGLPETIEGVDLAASQGSVKVGPIQLEALGLLLPPLLRAQGQLNVDAHWTTGLEIGGSLEFNDLATHPLPTSGPVTEIQGRVELEGKAVRIRELGAMLGGRRLALEGWVDLEPTLQAMQEQRPGSIDDLFKMPLPLWDIALTADRIPVVRRPGMVIRTSMDVRTTHDGTSTPLIAGTVTPRESVFVTDVLTLLPSGPATPMPRPPFVRIDHPLLADWRLKLEVQGDEFLRVRSPVFRGLISVGMTVSGQLREPVLIGDVMIADGQVQFPFGNLRVTQGLVSLSEVDPTTPTLLVNATSRVYGYQITMNVSGTAESPAFVFSSNPPLASEGILLMLTAGQLPQDELTFTAQQRATALASYLGKTLLDSWALEEPGEERLVIRSGESISVGGRATYHLEYMLSSRWSLIGEYDEYDDMNAGVKFRLLHR